MSPKGSESDFEFEVWNFRQSNLTDELNLSIGAMHDTARLSMLRLYIDAKPKQLEEDHASDSSDVALVLANSGCGTDAAEVVLDSAQSSNTNSTAEQPLGISINECSGST